MATTARNADPATTATPPQQFITRARQALADGSFVRLGLGRPHGGDATLEKLLARPVQIQGRAMLSLVWRHRSKDITKNLPVEEALALLAGLLDGSGAEGGFHHAHLQTRRFDIQLAWGKRGTWGLRVGRLGPAAPDQAPAPPGTAPADAADAARAARRAGTPDGAPDDSRGDGDDEPAGRYLGHDRQRRHPLQLTLPFLADLGITDAQHRLVPAMARKWRQINKFAEVLGHAVASSTLATRDAALPVRVLDFGAGKGYLTFAVHQVLRDLGRVPDVIGVELRPALTGFCNEVAARLQLQGLRFDAGDVRSHVSATDGSSIDIMIALHACDTATDVALHRGITAGAAIILCSPCCHQELRPQLHSPPVLAPLLRHGIHQATTAEMLTDTMRALLLELAGWDTRVFEFISPEATSKNRMLLALRRGQPLPRARQQALRGELAALKAFFGVRSQTLETLLASAAHGAVAASPPT